jgi:lia operon protein LiaG
VLGKTTFTRVVIITAITAGAALVIAACIGLAAGSYRSGQLGRAGMSVDQRASLSLQGADLVSITSVTESIRVIEGTGDSLEAWLHGTISAVTPDAIPHLAAGMNGSTADIRVEQDRVVRIGPLWSNLTLQVSLPAKYSGRLALRTVAGGVEVADHAYAGIELSTTSGNVRVGAVSAADFVMHTTSGNLLVKSVAAERSDITSVSGAVDVKSITGNVTVGTTSGEVTLACGAMPSGMDVGSTSGGVTVRLPQDAAFVLDAHSTSGIVTCRFPITISESSSGGGRRTLSGTVGSGAAGSAAPKIAVHTVSGDIRIEH